MKWWLRRLITVVLFLAGAAVFLYPLASGWLYERSATRVIGSYTAGLAAMPHAERLAELEKAEGYNAQLTELTHSAFAPLKAETMSAAYLGALDVGGVMAWLEIPAISVYLPVYHGTSEAVLLSGVGHIEGSSLPVGGAGTHAALTAHSGLPKATLFNDLELLAPGDVFFLHVLEQTLAYEVDSIQITPPGQTEALSPVPGEDYVTLITCTPYAINSDRLLVRGTRAAWDADGQAAPSILATRARSGWWKLAVPGVFGGALVLLWRRPRPRAK